MRRKTSGERGSDILAATHYTRRLRVTKPDRFLASIAQLQRYRLCRFAWQVWRNFRSDRCMHTASALTYLSLFAVVPLLTVGFAMLSAIPAFAEAQTPIQQFIFSHFLPSTSQEIQTYLIQFSLQARQLTGLGIAFLAVNALMMLVQIEQEFNVIWRAQRNRTGLSSFLRYWAILTLGPLCIGLAIGISTYLASLHLLFDQVDIFGVRKLLLIGAPYVLTAIAFTLLFAAIPNARVLLKDAAIGGLASALCFEIAKYVFARVMANASYQFIYGTFAAIPLFLLWIYTSWIIVLVGAEIAHAVANYDDRNSELSDLVTALGVLEILWRKHQHGEALSERDLLQRNYLFGQYTLAVEQWAKLRALLLDIGLIRDTSRGEFVLGRNLQHYTLSELYAQFDNCANIEEKFPSAAPSWLQDLQKRLTELHVYQHTQLQLPLAILFEDNNATAETHRTR